MAEGMWKLDAGEWDRQLLVAKKSRTEKDGECTRTYTAVCSEGVIEVKKTCEKTCLGEEDCLEKRALSRSLGNWIKSSGSDLRVGKKGEYAMEVYDPDWQSRRFYNRETGEW